MRRYKASVAFDSTCRDLIKSATLCFERSSCSGRTRPAATCSGPWQRSIEACRWVAMRAAHRRGTSKAIRTFGLTAACHAPTSIFDGSSTDKLWRHGVGVGCDEAETPRRTPVTLLAAAAVGVSEVSKSFYRKSHFFSRGDE